MARFKKMFPSTNEGKIIYGNGIVDSIVLLAMREVPNVELLTSNQDDKMRNNSINVSIEKDGVHVDVVVKIHYSQNVSDVAFKIQEAIRYNVEAMTEYHVASVNVAVRGVMFDDKTVEEKPTQTSENQQEG